ncbi:hypothetical protein K2173_021773 [Erythroxylum novogranatense]|uniref:non-specific serine/threonine protein kinase n=1 Tax=Erythroxylum novogranatense TaxID=1862640 RepID=A0AAV8TXK6_9ROSI|nr:hypothetical protein K2173_021773 [Erythroxylum novogranatense]
MNLYTSTILSSFVCLQLILLLSSNFQWCQANYLGNETDRIALFQFKSGITSDPFGIFNSWNASASFCNWHGITCGRRRRVTSLNITGKNLVGTISPYIGNLSFLRILGLRNNSFTGEIPQEVGNLLRLRHIVLSHNILGGDIPTNLSHCTKLEKIVFAYNKLVGKIPEGIGSLAELNFVGVFQNNLTGKLPSSLGNLTLLSFLFVGENNLAGKIPVEIGKLSRLTVFDIAVNSISGTIPETLFNISSLGVFIIADNQIRGTIPYNIGLSLPNLRLFGFGGNRFYGSIPESFGNATKLELIGIHNNNFVGQVPITLGNLKTLRRLRLSNNSLGSRSANDLIFLTSLKNCTNLEILALDANNFGGVLPTSLTNLSSRLSELVLGGNYFTGSIPAGLNTLVNLSLLDMDQNHLTGSIPSELGMLTNLQALHLASNRLSGQIPSSIGNLSHLFSLYLDENHLEGNFPSSIGNCQSLGELYASKNKFSGTIPKELLSLPFLSKLLNLSWNSLTGNLPTEVKNLKQLNTLDISTNNLYGEIPTTIGKCLSMEKLYMNVNFFRGSIPSSLASLKGLQELDLSQNNLTGEIPQDLHSLKFLSYLNLSFNDLEGEVPTRGVFTNASVVSLIGNRKLCGGVPELLLPKCPTKTTRKSLAFMASIIIPCVAVSSFMIFIIVSCLWRRKSRKKSSFGTTFLGKLLNVSYKDLHQATGGFSESNLIGSGSFGSVYRGFLDQLQRQVAVKVLNLQNMGASQSFLAECKTLGNIRHQNLVKILTYCSSLDYKGNEFMAIVYQFMENGSLENWLHPDLDRRDAMKNFDLLQRLNIAIDVSSALHYLHDQCESSIIHRDLKPSNILLDSDMIAHVSDFGVAKIISAINDLSQSSTSSTGIKGTIGYAAPEYGMGSEASKEGDVFSYGILVLEMFSGRRPTDQMFKDGLNLRDFIGMAMPERLEHIIDPVLLETESTRKATSREDDNNVVEINMNLSSMKPKVQKCLLAVFEVGVTCSSESPNDRMNIGDVNRKLRLIRNAFLCNSVSRC